MITLATGTGLSVSGTLEFGTGNSVFDLALPVRAGPEELVADLSPTRTTPTWQPVPSLTLNPAFAGSITDTNGTSLRPGYHQRQQRRPPHLDPGDRRYPLGDPSRGLQRRPAVIGNGGLPLQPRRRGHLGRPAGILHLHPGQPEPHRRGLHRPERPDLHHRHRGHRHVAPRQRPVQRQHRPSWPSPATSRTRLSTWSARATLVSPA